MNHVAAQQFVNSWLQAWNTHDLDEILSHFTEEVTFRSPMAVRLLDSSDGVVRGKTALREYWAEGLRRMPELHFELMGTYIGVDSLVINYKNERGGLVNEVLIFKGSLVVEGYGTYLGVDAAPASGLS
ncbi:nuclear transport factor 2 family protein [Amycolatopsis sp. A133]|uniref:nuclear transport factor 2 family protein n=1 Tax=Amycolatopsis sp. A133 TaxID=3064472 RepID=UPI0027F262CA|nr:nuclear transport factor 2 family protein [Amycolatopsis sp. A133]MDQ7809113.1 nuclear transport factor 2 family protein [Amycolatopsis sp. A133]